jgi:uncharacterized protein YceK
MKSLFLGVFLMMCSGCATFLARSENTGGFMNFHNDGLYPATRLDATLIGVDPLLGGLFLLDLPISLTFDTLLFPLDVAQEKL